MMVQSHVKQRLKERYEGAKRKIETEDVDSDELIAIFRLAKRHEDWEFCWRLYVDWISPLLDKYNSSGTTYEMGLSNKITHWLDEEWVQKSSVIGGWWKDKLWNQFLYNLFEAEKLSSLQIFGHMCLEKMPTMTSLLSTAWIVTVQPNGYVCPGPNFPDLIPIPEKLFELW